MKVLVVGATGATGRLVVQALLQRGHAVQAVVRNPASMPADVSDHPRYQAHVASVHELPPADWDALVADCEGFVSCLGHRLSLRGIFGPPRRLVTDVVRRIAQAVIAAEPKEPARLVLMNTSGNRNRDLDEKVSFAQRVVVGGLRILVPPHADNEDAAEVLRTEVGPENPHLRWVAVRPDGLFDAPAVEPYDVHPSPTRSAIFNAGKTSRIQVADFMGRLLSEDELWERWQGQMPVLYDRAHQAPS